MAKEFSMVDRETAEAASQLLRPDRRYRKNRYAFSSRKHPFIKEAG